MTRNPRTLNPVSAFRGACVLAGLALFVAPAGASSWMVRSEGNGDNVGLLEGRASATWYSDGTRLGWPQVQLSWHHLGTPELSGIPGGTRQDVAVKGTWIAGIGSVRGTAVAGLDVLTEPRSWRGEIKADWFPGVLRNMRTTLRAESGWLDGWLSREVRTSAVTAALGWDGPRTWAEIGAQVEDRSGGIQPGASRAMELPYNRIPKAWAWATRAWTPWLQAGLAANWADSRVETHQPTGTKNDTLQWIDYPYGSPHDAFGVNALLRLSWGPVWASTAWPLWSTSRQRVESVYAWDSPYWYTLENAAMAEVKVGGDLVVAHAIALGLEASALSLPYESCAWFTEDSWTRLGLSLTTRFTTP